MLVKQDEGCVFISNGKYIFPETLNEDINNLKGETETKNLFCSLYRKQKIKVIFPSRVQNWK